MFTEDYLLRIINQALAALMTAIGFRKSGKYSQAWEVIQQAIEQVTGLPAHMVDQLDDTSILALFSVNTQSDLGRLVVLADLFQEQAELFQVLGQPAQGSLAYERSLRFLLEAVLADDSSLTPENIGKISALCQKLTGQELPLETRLSLHDYYQGLLEKDDQILAEAGISRDQVEQDRTVLQNQLGSTSSSTG